MNRAWVLAFLAAFDCAPKGPPPQPPPPAPPDCEAACARLHELHCPEALDSPAGADCLDVCQNNTQGEIIIWTREFLGCVQMIQACDEVLACHPF